MKFLPRPYSQVLLILPQHNRQEK